jgi:hypothetical protein
MAASLCLDFASERHNVIDIAAAQGLDGEQMFHHLEKSADLMQELLCRTQRFPDLFQSLIDFDLSHV